MAFNYDSDRYSDCSGSKDHQMAACNGAGGGIEMMPLNQWDNVETSVLVPPGHQLSYDPVLPQTPRTPQKKILSQGGQSSSNNPTPKKQLQFSTSEIVHEPPISIITSRALLPNRKREEAMVMANLRKKVPAFDLTRRKNVDVEGTSSGNNNNGGGASDPMNSDNGPVQLDNRPSIPKISSKTGLSLMDSNNNTNSCDDSSSVKGSSSGGSGGVAMQDKDFVLELLCWHNEYRARHGVTALSISAELCEYAQIWANHLAATNEFYYRSDKSIGQNLFCCPVSALVTDLTGQEVASYWYSTIRKYNYFKEPHLLHTNVNAGHFAQIVWASSKYLGVGKSSSKTGKIFVVAFYFPPGNQVGSFHTNVLPPLADDHHRSETGRGSSQKLIDGDNNPLPSILKQ